MLQDLQVFLDFCKLVQLLRMEVQVDSLAAAGTPEEALGQDIVDIVKLHVALHRDVKGVRNREITESHQVAHGLNNVPR